MYLAPVQPPRQRLPDRVYVARRVVAGIAAVAVLFLLYTMVTAVFGGPSQPTSAAPTAPSTSLIVSDGVTPLTPASTSTSTTELLRRRRRQSPSAADPAELYVAGDSDAGTFGPYLDKLMKQTGMVSTTLDYKVSSGLSRPDFFDWPSYFAQQIPAVNPDIVVVTFGGNDAQGLRNVDKTWAVQHTPGSGGRRRRLACRVRQAGRRGDGLPRRRQPHADLGRHPQRRQPRRHRPAAGAERGRHGRGRQAPEGRVHRHVEAVLRSQRRFRTTLCRILATTVFKECAARMASTSTRPAPRSSRSTSPKPSAPNCGPAAAPSNRGQAPIVRVPRMFRTWTVRGWRRRRGGSRA